MSDETTKFHYVSDENPDRKKLTEKKITIKYYLRKRVQISNEKSFTSDGNVRNWMSATQLQTANYIIRSCCLSFFSRLIFRRWFFPHSAFYCVRRYWNSSPAPGLLLSESVSYHTWTTAIIIILLHAFRRLCGICSFRADTQNLVCRTSFIHFNLRRCLNPISKHTHTHSSHSHSCPFILITYFVIS